MNREIKASKSYDIQASLGNKQVDEFENLPIIGMMVNLSLHIRGLPKIEYEILKTVANHYFNIPPLTFREVILNLAEIEFVKLYRQGDTIKEVIPNVPFFDNVYERVGEFADISRKFNEAEDLALKILIKLSDAPTEKSNLFDMGAEKKLVTRNLSIGEQGGYLLTKRTRGKDIILSPVAFSENGSLLTELVAKAGTKKIQRLLELIKKAQGWPLSLIEKNLEINGEKITKDELGLIKELASDGMVKPPAIETPHTGRNYFIFTPSPGASKLNPSKREIYERAMALIASVRQGQLMPKQYAIKYPAAILNALKRDGSLRPTSEAFDQYASLAAPTMKVGRLEKTNNGWYRFVLNQTDENIAAIDLAISLLQSGNVSNMELNDDARIALQKDQLYIDSIVSRKELKSTSKVQLSEEMKEEIDNLFLKGMK